MRLISSVVTGSCYREGGTECDGEAFSITTRTPVIGKKFCFTTPAKAEFLPTLSFYAFSIRLMESFPADVNRLRDRKGKTDGKRVGIQPSVAFP